ncbi:hypothetical protein FA15DRAFT_711962 [Coprinopsis marcescibilis]|uniref:Uncharacterized protein n=1 Tax=Coprinopsis marcescibilis TaxID=230819 RepID=A0A5C3K908_COPMA|nr:hypothetical protein FA15DRAFT_711962 [Coprinopsis marcescibilis]
MSVQYSGKQSEATGEPGVLEPNIVLHNNCAMMRLLGGWVLVVDVTRAVMTVAMNGFLRLGRPNDVI